ncbi:MAG: DUF2798 domain-containing protein [Anaerovoracaceae bacterium]
MIEKKYYSIIVNFWFSLFNGISVSATMIYLKTGMLIIFPLIISSLEAFVISFITGLVIPAAPFGAMIAGNKLNFKPGSFKYILISNIPVCFTMAFILSLAFAIINVGLKNEFITEWFSSIPIAFIASYITSVLLTPLVLKLSDLLVKK